MNLMKCSLSVTATAASRNSPMNCRFVTGKETSFRRTSPNLLGALCEVLQKSTRGPSRIAGHWW